MRNPPASRWPVLAPVAVSLGGCRAPSGGPDLGPVGDGLAFIGVCLVVAMLLFLMNGQRHP